jgi:Bacteriophage probable baseplate hub protein
MAAASAYPVRVPQWVLSYQGVNITADVSRMVLRISYCDYLGGLSGELDVAIEDHGKRWQGAWFPALGDRVNLAVGYQGEALLPCGDFQVDQLELGGPPDVFCLRCLAAFITPAMRTRNTAGYENQTLGQIARAIAGKYGFSVVSAPDAAELRFARVTQADETDLGFLKRLAREHDYDFTVRGTTLVFYARRALEQAPAVATVARSDTERFAFSNRSHRIYRAAEVAYQDARGKQLIAHTAQASPVPSTGDTLKLDVRSENGQQAAFRAEAALHARNRKLVQARLVLPGSAALAAGVNVALCGFGGFDGTYLIDAARHRLDHARGYTTELEARRVQ